MKKAVYGTLLAAIIFYNKLSFHLVKRGFKCNEYNMCTFNKIVDGHQLTVQFHVNDLKASQQNKNVLQEFINKLRAEFSKEDKLMENKGLIHDYLGITIDYSLPRKMVFTMFDYLEDIIVECPDDLKSGTLIYPSNNSLFKVHEDLLQLTEDQLDLFHRVTTWLLFVAKRAQPDL